MNKTNIFTTILIIVLSLVICFFILEKVVDNFYLKGYQIGYQNAQTEMFLRINQQGVIPVISQVDNSTEVNWISVNEVCGK